MIKDLIRRKRSPQGRMGVGKTTPVLYTYWNLCFLTWKNGKRILHQLRREWNLEQ